MKDGAVIWDLDGVIVNSAPFHFRAWQELAEEKGIHYGQAEFKTTFGMRNEDIIRKLFGENTTPEEITFLSNKKEENFRSLIKEKVKPLPGVIELLRALEKAGFKQAIASSTPLENIELIIKSLKIEHFFDIIVSSEDVSRGKPDPEVFLKAAEKLGMSPDRCVVIEDAAAGLKAARAAGMKSIAVTNTLPREKLQDANMIVDTLEAVRVDAIENMLPSAVEL